MAAYLRSSTGCHKGLLSETRIRQNTNETVARNKDSKGVRTRVEGKEESLDNTKSYLAIPIREFEAMCYSESTILLVEISRPLNLTL